MARMLQADGRAVVASGRNREVGAALSAAGVRFMPADLTRDRLEPLVKGVDTIFHLAALSSPWGDPAAFEAANILATKRLIDAARSASCRRFLFASTPSIYTRTADQLGLTEASALPSGFANAYARTKYAAERIVLAASAPGFATVALRPRAIISPFDMALLPRLLRAAEKGVLPLPSGGRALIEPTDARDATRAFIAAESAASAISGQVLNISGGVPLPVRDVARHLFTRLERTVQIVNIPRWAALFGAGVAEVVANARSGRPEPKITRYGATVLGWSQSFDLTAARTALAWQPLHEPLDAIDWALNEMRHA